jgi:hypothetical protein
VPGQSVCDGILFGGYPLAIEIDVEQSRDEEGSLQDADRCAANAALVDGRYDRLVVAEDQQRAVLELVIPREESVVDRVHLLPVDVLFSVGARDACREHEVAEMPADAFLPTGVGGDRICRAEARELDWDRGGPRG